MTVARLFFGLYEGAEIRFISRELRDAQCVVDLGASLGITGSFALAVARVDAELVCVEANPLLISTLWSTLRAHRRGRQNVEVISGAVAYGLGDVALGITEGNVGSAVGLAAPQIAVARVSLAQALRAVGDPREFCLICDIEGAEHHLLKEEGQLLERCRVAIVECHDSPTSTKTWVDAQAGFEAAGLTIRDRRGRVTVYRRMVD